MSKYQSAAVEGMQLYLKFKAKERERRSRSVLIVAEGYDVSVPEGWTRSQRESCMESALGDYFSSCGKIESVCIPHVLNSSTLNRVAYIYILGEGAEEKALPLNGSEMDGHKLVVAAPLRPMKMTRKWAFELAKADRFFRSKTMIVRGYDTSLPKKFIKSALSKHFSSCGEVLEVEVHPNKMSPDNTRKFAFVSIYGKGAAKKALKLSGSDMGGFKLVVEKAFCVKSGGETPDPDFRNDFLRGCSFPENRNEKKKKKKTSK